MFSTAIHQNAALCGNGLTLYYTVQTFIHPLKEEGFGRDYFVGLGYSSMKVKEKVNCCFSLFLEVY